MVLSGYSQGLQIKPQKMSAQIFLASFWDMTFFMIFLKFFSKNLKWKASKNLKIPILKSGPVRVLSRNANLASIRFNCQEITFLSIFEVFKKFR